MDAMTWNGAGLRIPAGVRTLDKFRNWARSPGFPEHGRISFINGDLHIDMSPDELEHHNKVRGAICHTVITLNDEQDWGEFFLDGALVTNSAANLATVPDASLVKWETSASGKVRFVPRKDRAGEFIEIRGTPDWLLEAVSFSSLQKDTEELPLSYHRAGVPEFWLVDARGQEIDFRILVHRPRKYQKGKTRAGWHHSPLFGMWFRLVRHLNRQDRWTYKLEVKS